MDVGSSLYPIRSSTSETPDRAEIESPRHRGRAHADARGFRGSSYRGLENQLSGVNPDVRWIFDYDVAKTPPSIVQGMDPGVHQAFRALRAHSVAVIGSLLKDSTNVQEDVKDHILELSDFLRSLIPNRGIPDRGIECAILDTTDQRHPQAPEKRCSLLCERTGQNEIDLVELAVKSTSCWRESPRTLSTEKESNPQLLTPSSSCDRSTPGSPLNTHPVYNEVAFDIQDGVVRLRPNLEEWEDFPGLLRRARDLGSEEVGICKILVPEGVPGRESRHTSSISNISTCTFRTDRKKNMSFRIIRNEASTTTSSFDSPATSTPTSRGHENPVSSFEAMLSGKRGLRGVRYGVDLDAGLPDERTELGLPDHSPIASLKGNQLNHTRTKIAGVHTIYNYKSGPSFGAPFAMHIEDWNLMSVNYLRQGVKTITVVPPESRHILEEKIRKDDPNARKFDCSQVLRHSPTYFPLTLLHDWGIPFVIIHQQQYEVFVTFKGAPHQGFSHGITDAEAVNYADDTWSMDGYDECTPGVCSERPISRSHLEISSPREKRACAVECVPESNMSETSEQASPSHRPKRARTRRILDNESAAADETMLQNAPSIEEHKPFKIKLNLPTAGCRNDDGFPLPKKTRK